MTQYGQKVILLSDLVRKFCMKQGNIKQQNFLRQMEFASWAWKELFRTSVWEISTVVLDVDPVKHTICLPDNCERLVNISVMDRLGRIQPLTWNPHMSTVSLMCQKNSCACPNCGGVDTLCEAVGNITATQEQITVNGQEYTQVTYVRSNGCGSLEKEIHTFAFDPVSETVKAVVLNELLCEVEVNTNGCLLATKSNINALEVYAGYNAMVNNAYYPGVTGAVNPFRPLIPSPYNYFGYWNWNAASRDIIHIFRSSSRQTTYANCPEEAAKCGEEENEIKKVIVSFQAAADSGQGEMLIPEYAEMAVNVGMLYQQALFNPRDMDRNRTMEVKFNNAKKKVQSYLNPVRIDDIIKVQSNQRIW